jgi:hypothetical protein
MRQYIMELLYLRRLLFPVATSSSGPSGQPIGLLLHMVEAVLSREFIGMPHGASAYVSLGEPHITCMCGLLSHNESKFATNKKFSVWDLAYQRPMPYSRRPIKLSCTYGCSNPGIRRKCLAAATPFSCRQRHTWQRSAAVHSTQF